MFAVAALKYYFGEPEIRGKKGYSEGNRINTWLQASDIGNGSINKKE
jgi:hypothetical protein